MPAAAEERPAQRGQVDLDLHGFVGVRLVDAEPADVATVVRQLGPLTSVLQREPDIVVRFVDRLEPRPASTTVGLGTTTFGPEGLRVVQGRGGVPAQALLPLQDVGGRCEIVCERAMPAVPLLLAIVNYTALAHGVLPLHASAFEHEGRGTVVCGWAKGGKTEVLLAFMARGARYVGDEWVYLVPGGAMYGVPEPIRLWQWQLRQLTDVWSGLRPGQRGRLRGLGAASSVGRRAGRLPGPAAGLARRSTALVDRQQWVQLRPDTLFGSGSVALRGTVDDLVLTSVHDQPGVRLEPVSGSEVGDRMRASLRYERSAFVEVYEQFRFAFPDRASEVVDTAAELEAELLRKVVPEEAAWLRHPHPVDIASLYAPVHDWVHR